MSAKLSQQMSTETMEFISQVKQMGSHTWFRSVDSRKCSPYYFSCTLKQCWLLNCGHNRIGSPQIIIHTDRETIEVHFLLFFQKSCIDFAINATPLERYMPEERVGFKYRLWRIVESTPFEYFIMTLIVLNTILLMMKVSTCKSRWRCSSIAATLTCTPTTSQSRKMSHTWTPPPEKLEYMEPSYVKYES